MLKYWSLFWLPLLAVAVGLFASQSFVRESSQSLWSTLVGSAVQDDRIKESSFEKFPVATEEYGEASLISSSTCTWEARHTCEGGYRDPNLFPMTVRLGGDDDDENREASTSTFWAYIDPDVSLMYNKTPGSVSPKETTFRGKIAKFVNLGPETLHVYWEESKGGARTYIAKISAFHAAATASFPSHRFVVVNPKTEEDLITWVIDTTNSLYFYDPFNGSVKSASMSLTDQQFEDYKLQRDNLIFNKQYEKFTGRQWLGLYKRKHAPRYPMWPADSLGQTHVVKTRQTHLLKLPPSDFANKSVSKFGATAEERKLLEAYRDPNQETLALNLTVISTVPRVFEIKNFLSRPEVDHIMELATGMTLGESSTGSNAKTRTRVSNTRTSRNSWISRDRSVILDSIHRRYFLIF
jgi:hypothetical protein